MGFERHRTHDSEIPAASFETPEQIGILDCAGLKCFAFGGDERSGLKAVASQTNAAMEPAHAASQRKSGDFRQQHDRAIAGEAERLRGLIELGPGETGSSADNARLGIDRDLSHTRHVEEQATVAGSVAGGMMSTAFDCDWEAAIMGVTDRRCDVKFGARPHDERGVQIEQGIPDPARLVVPIVARLNTTPRSSEGRAEGRAAVDI